MFAGIDTIVVKVQNLMHHVDWYHQNFGIEPSWLDEDSQMATFPIGEHNSLTLMQLRKDEIKQSGSNTIFPVFSVEDVNELHQRLLNNSVKVESIVDAGYIKFFGCYDLDGNRFELCETVSQ